MCFIHPISVNLRTLWVVCWPREKALFFHFVRISEMSPHETIVSWWNHFCGLFCLLSSLNRLTSSACTARFTPVRSFWCILQAGNFCWILSDDLYTSEFSWNVVVGRLLCGRVEGLNLHNKISSSSQEKPTVSITDVMCVALSSVWLLLIFLS